jgi:hypothetical protein
VTHPLAIRVRERCPECDGLGWVPDPIGSGTIECPDQRCQGVGHFDHWLAAVIENGVFKIEETNV